MFVRASTHRAIVREKDREIQRLIDLVESQSERILVIAGYRPLMPQRGPIPVAQQDAEALAVSREIQALDLVAP